MTSKTVLGTGNQLADEIFCLRRQYDLLREVQLCLPVDNLPVRLVSVLRAEGRPSNKTFKHDSSERPPIAFLAITVVEEDFRRDIIRCTDSRVSHEPPGLTPCINLVPVGDGQVDSVDHDGVAWPGRGIRGCRRRGGRVLQQTLVPLLVMRFMKPSRETKVGELDMAIFVNEDIVGLDITAGSQYQTPTAGHETNRWMKPNLCTASMASTHSAM